MTNDRLPWFPCDPSALLGALASMKPAKSLVYVIVLLRIYESEGPCRDTIDSLATRTKLSRHVVSEAMDSLFADGRLVRTTDGIMNPVAERVLADSIARRQKRKHVAQKGGIATAKKHKEIQQKEPADSAPTEGGRRAHLHLHLQLQKERKKEESESSDSWKELPFAEATGVRDGESDWPSDYREKFWNLYPRKTEKKAALAKLDAIRKSKSVKFVELISGVERLIDRVRRERTLEKYIKHPATWLNRGCWEDQFAAGENGNEETRRRGGLGFGSIAAYGRAATQG